MIKQLIRESLERLEDRIIVKKDSPISKGLKYHIDNEIPIHESVFRMGSKSWINLLEECRKLVSEGSMEVGEYDMELLESDGGKTALFEGEVVLIDTPFLESDSEMIEEAEHRGKKVNLNKPFRTPGGPKKFAVYVKTPGGGIKKVTFGDPNLRVKNNNPKAAKSFRARHKCSQKKDKTTAGYWSCSVGRYAKQLGLSSSKSW
jgi:hypothetical protein